MISRRVASGLGLTALLGLALWACASRGPSPSPAPEGTVAASRPTAIAPTYWPTAGWRTASPEEQGMDAAKLAQMLEAVKEQRIPLHSLLIIRNGYIVSETYFEPYQPETLHDMWSVTKSVIATLIGIAQRDGDIPGQNALIAELLPESAGAKARGGTKAAITLEHLLTMTSGLGWVENDATFGRLYRSRDWVGFMLDLPMARKPGTAFSYCSGCSHLLSAIVAERTGENPQALAERELFAPLGIHDFSWEADPTGLPIGGWGLRLTPRDMAKLGYLYLNQGNWDGRQILPAAWVTDATTTHTPTDGELGYGYQWWTYPRWGAYAALGRDGQTIWVAPDDNLIVVSTAATAGHDPIFALIDNFVMPAVRR